MTTSNTTLSPYSAETFVSLIHATATAYGDRVAVTLERPGQDDQEITFSGLERESEILARGLIARGIGKGSRVGFIFGNGPSFAITLAAVARVGAVAIPLSTMIRSNELLRVLRQSDVSALIVQRNLLGHDLVERLCEALPALRDADPELRLPTVPFLRWIVSSGGDLPSGIRDISYLEAAAGTVSQELLRQAESEVHEADQFLEIYTSGSMALPKGVKHLHGTVMARNRYIAQMTGRTPGTHVAALMPMFWVGGLGLYLMSSWVAGATTVCTERTMSNSRMAMGTVLAPEDLAQMAQARPFWGLGMSETFGPYSYGDELRVAGYPLCAPLDHIADGFEVRVADEQDRPVSDGETGEIQVRGYAVTPALHKIERDAHFTADGYYRTGDQGLVNGSRILFTGRKGDMIKTVGSNVSPAEVEQELQALDDIMSAYVVGLPDPERGQLVVAALVMREGAEISTADIEAALRQRLSSYKVPRAYVPIGREEIPMLPSNKVSRRDLAALLARKLGRS